MANPLQLLAGPMGLEPTPSGLTGRGYHFTVFTFLQ
jgi:hypothetical protein